MGAKLGDVYKAARTRLRVAFSGIDYATPDLDARLLVAAACDVSEYQPLTDGALDVSDKQEKTVFSYIERRLTGEPVARILGEKEFWGLSFVVNARTLVPRQETEGIVESVLSWVDKMGHRDAPLRLVDLGTGTGAILIALLTELPKASGFAVDISKGALHVARENAARHGVYDRFHPIVSDYGDGLDACFDVVVSNPPYIRDGERESLAKDVRDFDPERALFAGHDGLDAYRAIFPWSAENLAPNGIFVVEHGVEQRELLQQLARKSDFKRIECVSDMANLPRFLIMWKKLT